MGRRLTMMIRSLVQRLAATDAFVRIGPKIVPRMDLAAHRLTRGRLVPSAQVIPTLVLTTTGSRSGGPAPRRSSASPKTAATSWSSAPTSVSRAIPTGAATCSRPRRPR
ncbi:hypothetical protein ACFQX6_02245 [Streptosporangium lutulentum]